MDDAVKKGPKGRILFIMAEHGSRGFCVNELTRATEAKGNIFVMKLQVRATCLSARGLSLLLLLCLTAVLCECILCSVGR